MKQRIEAAKALLAYLEECKVTAVICGGYARDTICDKPIRDVDLYVSEENFWSACVAVSGKSPTHIKSGPINIEVDPESIAYLHQSIVRQVELPLRDDQEFGLPTNIINVIGVTNSCTLSVQGVTDRYNLGICKAGIDVSGIKINDGFKEDFRDKQITLLRTGWGHEATMKQFLKLQAKYPWPLRVPKQEEGLF